MWRACSHDWRWCSWLGIVEQLASILLGDDERTQAFEDFDEEKGAAEKDESKEEDDDAPSSLFFWNRTLEWTGMPEHPTKAANQTGIDDNYGVDDMLSYKSYAIKSIEWKVSYLVGVSKRTTLSNSTKAFFFSLGNGNFID